MFADRARIYVRSGKGGEVMFPSAEKNMYLTAALTAETADGAEMSFSRWMKV